jgi:phosphate starvation-inducible membrane PsiE
MATNTSSIFAGIYLQFLENTTIYDILAKQNIVGCFLYFEDIRIVYKDGYTDIHLVLELFNDESPTLSLTIEIE